MKFDPEKCVDEALPDGRMRLKYMAGKDEFSVDYPPGEGFGGMTGREISVNSLRRRVEREGGSDAER